MNRHPASCCAVESFSSVCRRAICFSAKDERRLPKIYWFEARPVAVFRFEEEVRVWDLVKNACYQVSQPTNIFSDRVEQHRYALRRDSMELLQLKLNLVLLRPSG